MKTLKKAAIISLLVLSCITALFGQEIQESLAARIAGWKFRELISQDVIEKFLLDEVPSGTHEYAGFHRAYYSARSCVYNQHFGRVSYTTEERDNYYTLRAVTVARLKELLHGGGKKNLLLDAYEGSKQDFLATCAKLSPEKRTKLRTKIKELTDGFKAMKSAEVQKVFKAYCEPEPQEANRSLWEVEDETLGKNLSAKETLRLMEKWRTAVPTDVETPARKLIMDTELGGFAYRRWKEGGVTLLKKYIQLLETIAQDIPE